MENKQATAVTITATQRFSLLMPLRASSPSKANRETKETSWAKVGRTR